MRSSSTVRVIPLSRQRNPRVGIHRRSHDVIGPRREYNYPTLLWYGISGRTASPPSIYIDQQDRRDGALLLQPESSFQSNESCLD